MFGFGGSSSSSKSSSEQESYGLDVTTQALDPGQQMMQNQMFQQFMPALGYAGMNLYQGNQAQNALGRAQQVGNRGQAFGNNMLARGNKGFAGTNRIAQNAGRAGNTMQRMANQGMANFSQFGQQNNPYINQQIAGLAQDYGQLFNEQIMPGINQGFQGAGQRGSSRQGIAQALGAQRVGQEFGQAATNLRAGAYGQQQQAAQQYAQMAQTGALQNRALAGDLRQAQMQYGYGAGLDALGMQQQAAQQRMDFAQSSALTQQQLAMNPFQIGAGIVGQPSVLTQGLGMDYSYGKSKSSGSSSGLNLGMG